MLAPVDHVGEPAVERSASDAKRENRASRRSCNRDPFWRFERDVEDRHVAPRCPVLGGDLIVPALVELLGRTFLESRRRSSTTTVREHLTRS